MPSTFFDLVNDPIDKSSHLHYPVFELQEFDGILDMPLFTGDRTNGPLKEINDCFLDFDLVFKCPNIIIRIHVLLDLGFEYLQLKWLGLVLGSGAPAKVVVPLSKFQSFHLGLQGNQLPRFVHGEPQPLAVKTGYLDGFVLKILQIDLKVFFKFFLQVFDIHSLATWVCKTQLYHKTTSCATLVGDVVGEIDVVELEILVVEDG